MCYVTVQYENENTESTLNQEIHLQIPSFFTQTKPSPDLDRKFQPTDKDKCGRLNSKMVTLILPFLTLDEHFCIGWLKTLKTHLSLVSEIPENDKSLKGLTA